METTSNIDNSRGSRPISRRRALGIAGCAAGLAAGGTALGALLLPDAAPPSSGYRWRGVVLGAAATITVAHQERDTAQRVVKDCLAEIARLERIFSLYRQDSALTALNAAGVLADPPAELLALLSIARRVHIASAGAFDPTLQPLWRLYAEHFGRRPDDRSGPGQTAVAAALKRIGFAKITFDASRIVLRPGMALTLNGIAQGYIADRVAAVMRAGGIRDTLIDLGEIRALGRHSKNRPWRAGIAAPGRRDKLLAAVDLADIALATSADDGTNFDAAGRFGHILDPRTGTPARHNRSVSVRAPLAALADALSTALFVMPAAEGLALARTVRGASALVQRRDGRVLGWS
ncbi:MAG: FAD:protein FMN transferase [Alphaproteobacteria bacterium]|nr:FAD:protein FMN transferase [Alphaproteobacteria bacterium]